MDCDAQEKAGVWECPKYVYIYIYMLKKNMTKLNMSNKHLKSSHFWHEASPKPKIPSLPLPVVFTSFDFWGAFYSQRKLLEDEEETFAPPSTEFSKFFVFVLWMTSYWKQWSTKFFHFLGRFIGSDFKLGSKRIGQKHPMRWNIKSISNSRLSKIDEIANVGKWGEDQERFFWKNTTRKTREKSTSKLIWKISPNPCCAAWSRFQTTWPNRLPTWFAIPRLSLHSKALGKLTWPGKTTAEKHPISRNQCFDHVCFKHRNKIGML